MEADGIKIGFAAKCGGMLFLLWSILHIWVMSNGLQQYNQPTASLEMWKGLIGGAKVPFSSFQHPAPSSPTGISSSNTHLGYTCSIYTLLTTNLSSTKPMP